ncbi:MAG: PIN domain-containing protein [Thaumarchaeota archaeon]|nr:PIN domain-containing protein [Nitrososphaerota archaeon]
MSRPARGSSSPGVFLADTDLFFFYLRGGRYESQAEKVLKAADSGVLDLRTSSEVYDDAITAMRADGLSLELAMSFVGDMKSFRHTPLPMSAEIAEDALSLYYLHGGRRKLSYFDSFHVATARRYDLPLLTSDGFILEQSGALSLEVQSLASWK